MALKIKGLNTSRLHSHKLLQRKEHIHIKFQPGLPEIYAGLLGGGLDITSIPAEPLTVIVRG